MAAFFICRDFNAHPGLAWYRNDRAIIFPLVNKREEDHQANLNDFAARDVERSGLRQELRA